MRKLLLLGVVLALTAAACADPGEQAASDPTTNPWVMQSGRLNDADLPIVDGYPITLAFEDDQVAGKSACNQYFGSYTLSGNELTFAEMGSTMMACSPEEVMESEQAFLEAMALVETYSMDGDELTLEGDGVELVFVVDEDA